MEKYTLVLRHEYVDGEGNTTYIEDPIECSVAVNSGDINLKYLMYEMCEKIFQYLEMEEGEIN